MSQRKRHYFLDRLLTSIEAFQQLKEVQPHLKWVHGGQSSSTELLSTNGTGKFAKHPLFRWRAQRQKALDGLKRFGGRMDPDLARSGNLNPNHHHSGDHVAGGVGGSIPAGLA